MTRKVQRSVHWPALTVLALWLAGCASSHQQPAEAQRQFAAGLEEAFAMLQRSGIAVVRVNGPFQRPVLQWQPGMTLAQVILEAGYLEDRDPTHIVIQRGPTALPVDAASLLGGQDVPIESGDVIHVLP